MSEPITVTVTSLSPDTVKVDGSSSQTVQILNGGAVNVAVGTVSPGNATVVSGTLTINSTTTLPAGSQAYVKNDAGTAYAAKLDIGIPAGPVTNVTVGNTTTLESGNAAVTGVSSGGNLTLSFGIPRGPAGQNGTNGVTPSFAIGNVVTGAAGSSASVTATPSNGGANVTLDLTIPRGDPGTSGSNGTSLTLSDATPSALGTASAGTSSTVSRADHTHTLPVISYANLSNVPSNFATNTTLVSGLSAGYSGINHAHNYVTTLNNLTGALTLAAGSNVTVTSANGTITINAQSGLDANAVIDGGEYVGEIMFGILFSTQPQSVTANSTTTVNLASATATGAVPSSVAAVAGGLAGGAASFVSPFTHVNFATSVSSDDGASWSAAFSESIQTIAAIYAAPQIPATTASNGTRTVLGSYKIAYSESPTTANSWTSTTYSWDALNTGGYVVAYNGVRFAAVGKRTFSTVSPAGMYNVEPMSSSDGSQWTPRTLTRTQPRIVVTSCRKPLVAVNGVFVVCGIATVISGGSNTYFPCLWTSTDGVSWTQAVFGTSVTNSDPSAIPPIDVFSDMASSGSVAIGVTGTTARYTSNGTTWGTSTLPVSCDRVSYAAGFFWAFSAAAAGTDVCYSANGQTWTLGNMPFATAWQDMAGSSSGFAAAAVNQYARATIGATYGSANLTVLATSSGGSAISYQWQRSLDAGTTWSNVTNATSSTLSLTGLTTANSGTRYRAAASATGATTVVSQSATLTVTG